MPMQPAAGVVGPWFLSQWASADKAVAWLRATGTGAQDQDRSIGGQISGRRSFFSASTKWGQSVTLASGSQSGAGVGGRHNRAGSRVASDPESLGNWPAALQVGAAPRAHPASCPQLWARWQAGWTGWMWQAGWTGWMWQAGWTGWMWQAGWTGWMWQAGWKGGGSVPLSVSPAACPTGRWGASRASDQASN